MTPVATFCIYCYNEEKNIRAAIESALSQTYTPLEIVLSDDGSTDSTYAIMCEIASKYNGPHTILLNRNTKNVGIGGQINKILAISNGEIIIFGGGDDISYPRRTERIVRAWLESGKKYHSFFSDADLIDGNSSIVEGKKLDTQTPFIDLAASIENRFQGVFGATQAMTREVWSEFGPFMPTLKLEDNAILLRAALLGGYQHLPEKLVKYRVHQGNTCRIAAGEKDFQAWEKQLLWFHSESLKVHVQFMTDMFSTQAALWDSQDIAKARRASIGRMLIHGALADYYTNERQRSILHYWTILFSAARELLKLSIKSILPFIDRKNAKRSFLSRSRNAY